MGSEISIIKRGRPTKYTNQTIKRVMHYTNNCVKKGDFPTIEQLASYLGVGTRTIYDWEKQYSDFSQTLGELRDAQKHMLITGGLNGKYNARFASFLLKASHGFTDSKPLFEATQNNYLNISPELLADALEIMKKSKSKALND